MLEPTPAAPAAPPAPHQVAAFKSAKLQSHITMICGGIVTLGGAIIPAFTNVLGAHSTVIILAGALVTAAGSIQQAMAHSAYLQATDN